MRTPYKALRIKMMENDITQREVARQAGISPSTMSARMSGQRPFDAQEMQSIAEILDIPPQEYWQYFFPLHAKKNFK